MLGAGRRTLVIDHNEGNNEGVGRAQLCAYVGAYTYVEHSTLNSAVEQKLRDRKVEDRANATSSA